jgi:hypothetical protein
MLTAGDMVEADRDEKKKTPTDTSARATPAPVTASTRGNLLGAGAESVAAP